MKPNDRIYLAGHTGLVGSALLRHLRSKNYSNVIMYKHEELDLTDREATLQMFKRETPDVVILAAAKVGGIIANSTFPKDFLHINLSIQNNVIDAAVTTNVEKLLFLGSSCIYPRDCQQPIREEYFLSGSLEPTNRAYAVAKIAGVELCWACNRQHNRRFLSVMPTNMYGLGDNYEGDNSHVIPGLIRRVYEAKKNGDEEVVIWGTGSPRREFMCSDDLADACVFLLENMEILSSKLFVQDKPPIVNIGVGMDLTIRELGNVICEVVGFSGNLRFDDSKPDGTPRKLLDVSRMNGLGWKANTTLRQGIAASYSDFLQRYSVD